MLLANSIVWHDVGISSGAGVTCCDATSGTSLSDSTVWHGVGVSSLLLDSITSVVFLVEHDTQYIRVLHVQDLKGLFDEICR